MKLCFQIFRRGAEGSLEDSTNLVSSFSLSISASFCFNERLRMLTSFLSASVERWTASRSALSFLFSTMRIHNISNTLWSRKRYSRIIILLIKSVANRSVASFKDENGWQLHKQLLAHGIELDNFPTYRPSAIHRAYKQHTRGLLHRIQLWMKFYTLVSSSLLLPLYLPFTFNSRILQAWRLNYFSINSKVGQTVFHSIG